MTYDRGVERPRRSDRHAPKSKRGVRRAAGRRSAASSKLEEARNLPVQRQRRKERRKRTAIAVLAVIGVLVIAGLAYGYSYWHKIEVAIQPETEDGTPVAPVVAEVESGEPFTILLLGDDSRPGETMARSDTMIVAKIDPETGEVWLLSIPRDTRVEISGYGAEKINAATYYGGPELAMETAEDFLGIEIDYYMIVNFNGFIEVVDALGGVWVNVETEINDPKAGSHAADPDADHIDAGYQLLDGVHALTFVRSRDYVDADFTRMRNQQAFFKALAEQLKDTGNIIKIPSIVLAMAEHITTNMPLADIVDVVLAMKDSGAENIYTATVAGEWESPYVWTDEELKADLVARMTEGVSFDDTSTVAAQVVKPEDVTVAVRNGAGISGIAASAASVLSGAGFTIDEIGNAAQFVYDRTLIVYDEDSADGLQKAQAVSATMPIGDLVQSCGMYTFSTDILVVVGDDWETVTNGN